MSRIQRLISDVPRHWVGDGFPVRSLFSYHEGSDFDPFLLLDYAGPHHFEPAQSPRGVGVHPHRGFETVTIVSQGELAHRDSSGSAGTIGPGDVQWMTAASGVVHEEFHSERFTQSGGTLEMVQLWVNLPAEFKLTAPRYQNLPASRIPHVELNGPSAAARVIAGELFGVQGPAQTFTPVNLWELTLSQGAAVDLPLVPGHTSLLIVQSGAVRLEEKEIEAVTLALLDRSGDPVQLTAPVPSRILVLTGEPLREPVVGQGPFVMNTREQIREAILDFQSGKMGHLS